ncbi:hypothetical protein, partial [Dysgonomonas sp. 511]|uniref:hypothetical protein n=1 Tax=Dysgonomonas sp. 511 TaxID=2302930 RepID=UPI001C869FCB
IPELVNTLTIKMNEKGIEGNFESFEKNIDEVQIFYKNYFTTYSQDEQDILQQAFWAFCAKLLMDKLGGELVLGTKTDYGTGTPIYINYGNLYDKKGKKKWMGITFDTWFEKFTFGKSHTTLQIIITGILEQYG